MPVAVPVPEIATILTGANHSGLWRIKDLTDHLEQSLHVVRFCNETSGTLFTGSGGHSVHSVAAGDEDFDLWVQGQELLKAFLAAHLRHDEIQDYQGYPVLVFPIHIEGFVSTPGRKYRVSGTRKEPCSESSYVLLIIGQEYGLGPRCRHSPGGRDICIFFDQCRREIEVERRSHTGL